ncbi:hypothetical protein HDU96_004978, partial [Phlyctochytrium bullatum]
SAFSVPAAATGPEIPRDSRGLVTIAPLSTEDATKVLIPSAGDEDAVRAWVASLVEIEKADKEALLALISPSAQKSAPEFEVALYRWLAAKAGVKLDDEGSKKKKVAKDAPAAAGPRWASLPLVELAQPVIQALLTRILVKPSAFYPASALRYLIRTGRVPARIQAVPLPAAAGAADTLGLVEAVLEREDVETLMAVLEPGVVDLSEDDLVRVLKWVCAGQDDASGEVAAADVLQRRIARMDAAVAKAKAGPKKAKKKDKDAMDTDGDDAAPAPAVEGEAPGEDEVGAGRAALLEKVFGMPRNDVHMARAMRALRVEDLEVVLMWAKAVLVHVDPGVAGFGFKGIGKAGKAMENK